MTDRTPAEGAPIAGSGGRTRRDIDPAVARLLEARPAEFPPEPNLLHDPPRALVAIGAIVAIVASLLPWAARGGAMIEQVRQFRAPAIVVGFQLVTAILAAVVVGAVILATQLHPLAVVMPLILGTIGAGLIGANLGGRIGRRLVGIAAVPPPSARGRSDRT